MTGAQKVGELSIERGDDVQAIFFATKAAECLALAKALGWNPDNSQLAQEA